MSGQSVLRRRIKNFLIFYGLYAFFTAVLLFAVPYYSAGTKLEPSNLSRFWGDTLSGDRVALIEEADESIGVRVGLIQSAQQSIDVAYHSLHTGVAADVFFGSLIEAADRGVQVRILMDGIFHRLYGSMRDVRYMLQLHPNIEFRLYEPLNFSKPWTWNNRLHDKIMVFDNEIALISGRNVGDRYYLSEAVMADKIVSDYDVVVVHTETKIDDHSGVAQLESYFNLIWNHPHSKLLQSRITHKRVQKANLKKKYFLERLQIIQEIYPQYFWDAHQWLKENSIPVQRITLIHNPMGRGKTDPMVWSELVRLAEASKRSIVVQSPYIIPTRGMIKYFEKESLVGKEVILLTNSLASSPNIFAIAGYKGKKYSIKNWATEIWEYYGPGSLHGKALLFDDDLSAVGSFNIDARSSFLNTETMLVIHSREFNEHLRQVMYDKAEYSQPVLASEKEVHLAPWSKRILVRVMRFFAHFLDYLL